VNGFQFASLVTAEMHTLCELDILFLRASKPGHAIGGGDLDNRVKTLIDALRVPKPTEIPDGWQPSSDQNPLHCLLSEDSLVDAITVRTDRLLDDVSHSPRPDQETLLVISVRIHSPQPTVDTSDFVM
jgi:hypothetical protein